jgi:chaperonin GroES
MAKKKKAPTKPGESQGGGTRVSPMSDRVIIRFDAPEEVSPGGIVLPNVAQEKPQFATVTAVGPGRVWTEGGPPLDEAAEFPSVCRVPLQVKEGDRVIVSRYAGVEFQLGEQSFTIVREEDILAVCNNAQSKS